LAAPLDAGVIKKRKKLPVVYEDQAGEEDIFHAESKKDLLSQKARKHSYPDSDSSAGRNDNTPNSARSGRSFSAVPPSVPKKPPAKPPTETIGERSFMRPKGLKIKSIPNVKSLA
jgi:hypothetical protein